MTREEALKLLENEIYKWSMDWDEREDGLDYTEAIEIAIAALRPVSREQPTLTPPNEWVNVREKHENQKLDTGRACRMGKNAARQSIDELP